MDIKSLLGKLIGKLKGNKFTDGLLPHTVKSIGGMYWRMMFTAHKIRYIKVQEIIMRDAPDADPHVGMIKLGDGTYDNSFQNRLIGSVPRWVQAVSKYVTNAFLKCKWLKFPRAVLDDIEVNKGHFTYGELVQAIAIYQKNPGVKGSRASRYDEDDEPKIIPTDPTARQLSFRYYDLIAYGISLLMMFPPEEQEELLKHGIVSGSNCGWPFFLKQTPDNVMKLFRKFVKETLKLNFIDNEEFITVKVIFSVIKYCIKKKFRFPYVTFYRTQIRKVRAVFGGHLLDKMIGSIIHAAKSLAFNKESCANLGIETHGDEYDFDGSGEQINTTKIPTYGGLPIISQLPWEVQFKILLDKLPPLGKTMTADEILERYGYEISSGDYKVNVVGEDYSKFDTTIIPEDLDFLRDHKKLGWLLGYILDDLMYSEVWTGPLRVTGVIFKSGHPLTPNFGNDVHLQRQFKYANDSNWHKREDASANSPHLLSVMDQSDDSVEIVIDWDMNDHNKWLEQFGLSVKPEESFDYQRDRIGIYLKTLFGDILRGGEITVMGEMQSKYLGLCHSERELTAESIESEVNVWKITGDTQLDPALSKISSGGPKSEPFVMEILKNVSDTRFGRDMIMAISHMDPNQKYKLYREDVASGLSNPAWLGNLDVLNLLVRDDV